ncbi:MAG TPA: hypothetical protein IAA71_08575 [Candidatus Pullichristensenella stercoripullorum]|nr:hypothetical protein [Candidatus Pullichristensenella stercoripullorum]
MSSPSTSSPSTSSPSTSSPSTSSPSTSATLMTNGTVVGVLSSLGIELPADFLATVPQPADASEEEVAAAQEVLEAINAFVTANDLPVVQYFGLDVQAAISEKLPLNMVADDLVLREFFALPLNAMAAAYDPAYGDIIIQMEFPVDFAEGDVVVPVLGILDPETNVVTWIALDAVVNADGFVEITFTEDVFAQIAEDSITMLAILA